MEESRRPGRLLSFLFVVVVVWPPRSCFGREKNYKTVVVVAVVIVVGADPPCRAFARTPTKSSARKKTELRASCHYEPLRLGARLPRIDDIIEVDRWITRAARDRETLAENQIRRRGAKEWSRVRSSIKVI